MFTLNCQCGEVLEVPASFLNDAGVCPNCRKVLRPVGGGNVDPAADTARLTILTGPQRVGEQFFLAGDEPIEAGKLPDKSISLLGSLVSRKHCRFMRSDDGWILEDLGSKNGLLVNDLEVRRVELQDRDIIRIGEYALKFNSASAVASENEAEADDLSDDDLQYEVAPLTAMADQTGVATLSPALNVATVTAMPSTAAASAARPVLAYGTGPVCPCCEKSLAANAKICIECGIRVPSGRPISISRGMDEDALHENVNTWLTVLSFFMRFGLLPVASEAFGTRKARSVWVLLGLTGFFSAVFLIANWGDSGSLKFGNYMLWCGNDDGAKRKLDQLLKQMEEAPPSKRITHANGEPVTDEELRVAAVKLRQRADAQPEGEFHAYQLLTNAFLHGGLLHFAGNMLFLLVFGLRVNQLVGDLKFAIIYPLLAVCASLAYMASTSSQPLHPALGASGAVMGLAGMYFVMFPIQRVYMVFWLRIGWTRGMLLKIFRMPGFLLLVLWIGFNDLLPMVMDSRDQVAHWAHIGGFLSGMGVAIVLLVSRQATARGGDLLSFTLGRAAWPLIGKPNQHLGAIIAGEPRKRVLVSGGF